MSHRSNGSRKQDPTRAIATVIAAILVLASCGQSDSASVSSVSRSDPTDQATTSSRPDAQSELEDAICEVLSGGLTEDSSILEARLLAEAIRDELSGVTDLVGRMTGCPGTTISPPMIFGLAGFGPNADGVTIKDDRGSCEARGDYGGIVRLDNTMGSSAWDVRFDIVYIAPSGIVEHDTTEYMEVSSLRPVAWEAYMPSDLPAGGRCEITLRSVFPAR